MITDELLSQHGVTEGEYQKIVGILKRELDDVVTLTEEEIAEGIRMALRATHNLAEGAGAASLAAAMKLRDRLAGKKVVCVMSGGNIDRATLTRVLGDA